MPVDQAMISSSTQAFSGQDAGDMSLIVLSWIRHSVGIVVFSLFIPLVGFASDYVGMNTSHFTFYFHAQDERLMRSLIEESEEIRRQILEDLGIDFEEKIEVYLIPSSTEFQQYQPGVRIPSWSVGVAYPSLNLIIIKSPRTHRQGRIDLRKVFKHELTHVALSIAFKGREKVPRWLDEGLAMYEAKEWNFSRVSTMTRAVLTDSLIPLSEITHSFPDKVDRAELAYSESFYLISFLVSRYGKERFRRFIKDYSGGKGLSEVLMEVYGVRLGELEERWRNYLSLRFSWIPIITSTTTLWFLVTLVFVFGYLRKRRANRLKLEEWEREDQ